MELWDARCLAASMVHVLEEQDIATPASLGLSLSTLRRLQGGLHVTPLTHITPPRDSSETAHHHNTVDAWSDTDDLDDTSLSELSECDLEGQAGLGGQGPEMRNFGAAAGMGNRGDAAGLGEEAGGDRGNALNGDGGRRDGREAGGRVEVRSAEQAWVDAAVLGLKAWAARPLPLVSAPITAAAHGVRGCGTGTASGTSDGDGTGINADAANSQPPVNENDIEWDGVGRGGAEREAGAAGGTAVDGAAQWFGRHVSDPFQWTAVARRQLEEGVCGFRYSIVVTQPHYAYGGRDYACEELACVHGNQGNNSECSEDGFKGCEGDDAKAPVCPSRLQVLRLPEDDTQVLVRQLGPHAHPPEDVGAVEAWRRKAQALAGSQPLGLHMALRGSPLQPPTHNQPHQPANHPSHAPKQHVPPYSLVPVPPYSLVPVPPDVLLNGLESQGLLSNEGKKRLCVFRAARKWVVADDQLDRHVGMFLARPDVADMPVDKLMNEIAAGRGSHTSARAAWNLPSFERLRSSTAQAIEDRIARATLHSHLALPPLHAPSSLLPAAAAQQPTADAAQLPATGASQTDADTDATHLGRQGGTGKRHGRRKGGLAPPVAQLVGVVGRWLEDVVHGVDGEPGMHAERCLHVAHHVHAEAGRHANPAVHGESDAHGEPGVHGMHGQPGVHGMRGEPETQVVGLSTAAVTAQPTNKRRKGVHWDPQLDALLSGAGATIAGASAGAGTGATSAVLALVGEGEAATVNGRALPTQPQLLQDSAGAGSAASQQPLQLPAPAPAWQQQQQQAAPPMHTTTGLLPGMAMPPKLRAAAAEAGVRLALALAEILAARPAQPLGADAGRMARPMHSLLGNVWRKDTELKGALLGAHHPMAPKAPPRKAPRAAALGTQGGVSATGGRDQAAVGHVQRLQQGQGHEQGLAQNQQMRRPWRLSPAFLLDAGLMGVQPPWELKPDKHSPPFPAHPRRAPQAAPQAPNPSPSSKRPRKRSKKRTTDANPSEVERPEAVELQAPQAGRLPVALGSWCLMPRNSPNQPFQPRRHGRGLGSGVDQSDSLLGLPALPQHERPRLLRPKPRLGPLPAWTTAGLLPPAVYAAAAAGRWTSLTRRLREQLVRPVGKSDRLVAEEGERPGEGAQQMGVWVRWQADQHQQQQQLEQPQQQVLDQQPDQQQQLDQLQRPACPAVAPADAGSAGRRNPAQAGEDRVEFAPGLPAAGPIMPPALRLISVLAARMGADEGAAARAATRYLAIMESARRAGDERAARALETMGGAGGIPPKVVRPYARGKPKLATTSDGLPQQQRRSSKRLRDGQSSGANGGSGARVAAVPEDRAAQLAKRGWRELLIRLARRFGGEREAEAAREDRDARSADSGSGIDVEDEIASDSTDTGSEN